MDNMLQYKNYLGTVEYSAPDKVFYGILVLVSDTVTFEADNVKDLEKAFRESVDDYVETCKKIGKKPQRSFKGVFNVRIKPDLHRKAYLEALKRKISLNKFVEDSIQASVKVRKK